MSPLIPRCGHCGSSKEPLLRCSRCRVMLYCSKEHQAAHRNQHKLACNGLKQKQDHLALEEEELREQPTDDFTRLAHVFDTQVGRFWGIVCTREYMRARYVVLDALRKIPTLDAIQASLDHALDVLRLNRSDNMGVRYLIPALFLRLGKDQECYDFVKWYQTMGSESDYDWGDLSFPFLHIRNADALESVEYMCGSYPELSHITATTLLKIKLLLDMKSLKNSAVLGDRIPVDIVGIIQSYVPQSRIISSNNFTMNHSDYDEPIEQLSSQVDRLYTTVQTANKYLWRALLDPQDHLNARPESYSHGSIEEMQLNLQYCIDAWRETPGALEIIKAKLSHKV